MKVLIIAPTPYFSDRGCHVRIYEEAAALKRLGHEVLICTYHLGRNFGSFNIWRTPQIPWYKKTAAGASWHKFYLDLFLLELSAKAVLEFKPDIIHAHLHEGAFIALLLRSIFKKPVLFDYQGSLSSESVDHHFVGPKNPLLKLAKFVEHKVDSGADFLITSAPRDLKVSHKETVFDGVDILSFKPDSSKHRPQTLVYLGLLGQYQGTDLLLEAFSEVLMEFPTARLLIRGFPKIDSYQEKAKALGISENTEIAGAVDYVKAAEFLNTGAVAVAPKISTTEANQKILAYMACGLPVVAFDTRINRQMLGQPDFLAEESTAFSLAKKLKFMLSLSAEQLAEIGRGNRKRVAELYSWDRVGAKITLIYDRTKEIFMNRQKDKKKSSLPSLLIKLAISGLLLAWVFHKFDFAAAVTAVRKADITVLTLVLGLVVSKNVFSSLRWQVLLAARGPKVPFLELFRLYFIGIFFNNFLPSSVGGDIVKAYKLAKYTDKAFDSSVSVFMERFVGIVALAFIGAAAPMFIFGWLGVAGFIGFVGVFVFGLWFVGRLSGVHKVFKKLWGAIVFYKDAPRALAVAFGLSLIIQGLSLSSQYLVFWSLGYHLPVFQALVALPIINIATFVTLLPNGWGAQEALYALLFGMLGINKTISVTISLVYRFLTLLTALVGGLIYTLER